MFIFIVVVVIVAAAAVLFPQRSPGAHDALENPKPPIPPHLSLQLSPATGPVLLNLTKREIRSYAEAVAALRTVCQPPHQSPCPPPQPPSPSSVLPSFNFLTQIYELPPVRQRSQFEPFFGSAQVCDVG